LRRLFGQDEQDEQDGDREDENRTSAFLSTLNFQPYFRQDEQDGDEVRNLSYAR
jgi:hypothetical protein